MSTGTQLYAVYRHASDGIHHAAPILALESPLRINRGIGTYGADAIEDILAIEAAFLTFTSTRPVGRGRDLTGDTFLMPSRLHTLTFRVANPSLSIGPRNFCHTERCSDHKAVSLHLLNQTAGRLLTTPGKSSRAGALLYLLCSWLAIK